MVVHDVICNECGKSCSFPYTLIVKGGKDRTKIHQIRAMWKMAGWRVNLPGGKDYCPECLSGMKGSEK